MRHVLLGLAAAVMPFTVFANASAQERAPIVVGAGVGGTYYCIVSRCDTGVTAGGIAGVDVHRHVHVEAGVRRHFCFDCDRYWMAEASALLTYPLRGAVPFVGAGYGVHSDPEFFETTRWAPHVAAGAWLDLTRDWGLQLALRGRQLATGDRLGEASLMATRRLLR
jgi:hypothetical protein